MFARGPVLLERSCFRWFNSSFWDLAPNLCCYRALWDLRGTGSWAGYMHFSIFMLRLSLSHAGGVLLLLENIWVIWLSYTFFSNILF